jgi:hypothetical protein
MNPKWEVRIEDGVLEDLVSRPINLLVRAVLNEWLRGLMSLLERTNGYPPDAFPVGNLLGVAFENRLVALFTHHRQRFRTWKTLWLVPRERCEIIILWLVVLPPR